MIVNIILPLSKIRRIMLTAYAPFKAFIFTGIGCLPQGQKRGLLLVPPPSFPGAKWLNFRPASFKGFPAPVGMLRGE